METKLVYKAISAVAGELSEQGIKKERKQGSQVTYAFRGIDAVYNALAPALVKHGLLILPRCTERTSCERVSKSGGALFYITVRAEFDFVSVDDGSIHTVVTYGEAMDSGDKAT
ncbi:TPA: ERF family protein, partial [Yersinia enterocolitica]